MDAIQYYTSIADSYEKLYREEQTEKIKTILKLIVIKKTDRILDIGEGTGILEEQLPGSHITAVEPSDLAGILERKKLKNVKIIRSSASDLELGGKFDVVFCITVLQDLAPGDREICIKKAFALCRSGGRIAFSLLKASKIDLSALHPDAKGETANDVFYLFTKTKD